MFAAAQRASTTAADDGTSGATDSTLTDVTLTSAINSPGNTSTSSFSIPWAEDAIRQNKEFWERIERILYNEEDLPADETTRTELEEWQQAFPHLRVIGTPARIYYIGSPLVKASDPNYEEIFAIHPSKYDLDPRGIDLGLEDCLTITSGPSMVRRSAVSLVRRDNQSSAMTIKPLIEKVKTIEIDSRGRVTRNSVIYRQLAPVRSAQVLEPPEVGFLIRNSGGSLDVSKVIKTMPSSKSATYRVSQNLHHHHHQHQQGDRRRLMLPSINVVTPPLSSGIVGRSISATAVQNRKHVKRKEVGRLPDLSSDDSP